MQTFKFKVTVRRCKNCKILEEFIYPESKRKEAMMKVAEINGEPFRTVYASIETVIEGRDYLAEQAHASVARYIGRNWQKFRP